MREIAEPSIEKMLRDPIVRLRMMRARVQPEVMRTHLIEVAQRLKERACQETRSATTQQD